MSGDLDLRSDFPPPTLQEWREQVDRDLRDRCYEDLVWETDEGFSVKPLFTGEDTEGLPHLSREQAPQLQALLRPAAPWAIRERIRAVPTSCC